MKNATDADPSPDPRSEWGITTILVPLGVVAIVAYAATRWGWVGLVAGVLLGPVVVFLSIGLLGLAAMGLCFLFNREEFHRLIGKTPADDPDEPPYPGPPEIAKASSVPLSRGRFRIRTLLIVTLVLGLWLGVGLAMVRASKTQRKKEEAVLIVVLVPLGVVANYHAQRWGENFFLREKNSSDGEPRKP